MIRSTHPVAEEDLMAYLDGELPVARARECAAHLGQCSDCQALATDLKAVYQKMSAWQVGPAPQGISSAVNAVLEHHPQPVEIKTSAAGRIRQLMGRRWAWGLAGLCLVMVIVLNLRFIAQRSRHEVVADMGPYMSKAGKTTVEEGLPSADKPDYLAANLERLKAQAEETTRQYEEAEKRYLEQNMASSLANDSAPPPTAPGDEVQQTQNAVGGTMPSAPMIARTASVNLVAKDFDKARSELEVILRRHNGYAADLKLEAPPDQGRTLTASLRVPADQLDGTLAELKKLGRVEQESQGGEEVTEQYVDLNARLSNARSTEQRLLQVLNLRAGKMADILAVEQEIARVRGEIEQMEAERKNLEHRVAYTSLDVQLKEEYKAALEVAPPSEFAQMRNSLVEGLESAMDSLLGFARFLFYAGPTLLLWALILFFPVRFFWRRWRAAVASGKSSA